MSCLPSYDHKLLFFLASQAGLHGKLHTSTAKISSAFGTSQQTASRKLRQLHSQGLIHLRATAKGCEISISMQGQDLLRQDFLLLKQLFESKKKPRLQGGLKSGLGEGRYYVSRPFYLKQFKRKLGFRPFLGTLNLIVEPSELNAFLSGLEKIEIPGFKTAERSFGKIRAFKVLIQGEQPGAIVIPERSAHPKNEVEVISVPNLRKKFKLKDGSRVSLTLHL